MICTARKAYDSMSPKMPKYKNYFHQIYTGDLYGILFFDPVEKIIKVEPQINMGMITDELVPKGWALMVQVEMEALTVGGLLLGIGIETNSHKRGCFFHNVVNVEIVTSDGQLMELSKTKNNDLFNALPYSLGTLGIVTAVTLKVRKILPYVKIKYTPCYTQEEYVKKLNEAVKNDKYEFLEATIYSKNTAVIQQGYMIDIVPKKKLISHINRWYDPWYFIHVETALRDGCFEEIIPIKDYYHRYTRSMFWTMADYIPFGNTMWYRYLFGWLGAFELSIFKRVWTLFPSMEKDALENTVIQDQDVPIQHFKTLVNKFHTHFEVYPLLVFFTKFDKTQIGIFRTHETVPKESDHIIYVNVGAYGIPGKLRRKEKWNYITNNKKVEDYVRSVQGFQFSYEYHFMSEDEFWEMYDNKIYDKAKKKYDHLNKFPNVFIKTENQLLKRKINI